MTRTLLSRISTGGLIVLVGLALLARTTELFDAGLVWTWLPALFVVLGVWALLASQFRNLTGPVMVIAVAGAVLARNLDVISDATLGRWWPLLVVLFGVLLVVGRSRRRRSSPGATTGEVSVLSVLGGSERRIGPTFTGAEVLSVFGGSELDLRETDVPTPPAVLDTITLFGGTELRVPSDWVVQIDALALFGGIEDDRQAPSDGPARTEEGPDLVITGLVLFGGLEISH
ncbi:LiaF transmembrane domain-containing protein [Halococcoides cellulosivorans]|uniref:LiaF transmembrane domain-containing protein n=1 Tax=Halococcoides cellulosivorans TaxID=1679096 RepID=UPI00131EF0C6|nr:DUF5668 domain-containing protein [Halococcoides cellulosivorans]